MAKKNEIVALFSPRPLVRLSRLRAGGFEARGVPAILLGVAAIVAARGVTAALANVAGIVPESLREARLLWLAVRGRPDMLPQQR